MSSRQPFLLPPSADEDKKGGKEGRKEQLTTKAGPMTDEKLTDQADWLAFVVGGPATPLERRERIGDPAADD